MDKDTNLSYGNLPCSFSVRAT